MRDAGGQLTKRGELLGLDQAVLGGSQVLQRLANSRVRASTLSNSRTFSIASTDCAAESLQKIDRTLGKFTRLFAPDYKGADDPIGTE